MRAVFASFAAPTTVVLAALFAFACGGGDDKVLETKASVAAPPSLTLPDGSAPPVIALDTGRAMTAPAGDGVGIFVEYKAGGAWHVFWTCDYGVTSRPCEVDVLVAAEDGVLTDVQPEGFGAGDVADTKTAGQVRAMTYTTSQLQGVRFRATPGGVVALGATVRDVQAPEFLFAVAGGSVKGGESTPFTNPLRLRGAAP